MPPGTPLSVEVTLLMPAISDWERTKVRYGGLAEQLMLRDVSVVLVESHVNYLGNGHFDNAKRPINPRLGAMDGFSDEGIVKPLVTRDLTMPTGPKPLYSDSNGTMLVHHPSINELLISKSRVYDLMTELQPKSIGHVSPEDIAEAIAEMPGEKVVVKPDTGSEGKGVLIGTKKEVLATLAGQKAAGLAIVQEAIDMARGLEEYGIKGVHNVRFISIAGAAVFGFVRNDTTGSPTMQGETFENRNFMPAYSFRESLQDVLLRGQEIFSSLPHSEKTVVAFDLIRGINHEGEEREYILEINRRPLRNSPYDGRDSKTLWASNRWDSAEAEMLKNCVERPGP